ncbi:hypothetical protein GQ53DRAFT_743837 [Thozetella sp. PMI_491]|nr:hypothetical protein GQ53DRAFT_743837 [Thozetella sp. PMI_491]
MLRSRTQPLSHRLPSHRQPAAATAFAAAPAVGGHFLSADRLQRLRARHGRRSISVCRPASAAATLLFGAPVAEGRQVNLVHCLPP